MNTTQEKDCLTSGKTQTVEPSEPEIGGGYSRNDDSCEGRGT